MRVLVFHGYLLRGTGSNVYNASVARALARLGHEVHLLCQDREAAALPWVDAVGSWRDGRLEIEPCGDEATGKASSTGPATNAGAGRGPGTVSAYLPDIGGLLPVYVVDRYEGFEAKAFGDLTDPELDRYLQANVAAVRDVARRAARAAGPIDAAPIDAVLANHLVMGPAIVARARLAAERSGPAGFAAKIHGSALEFTVKPNPRFLPHAREGMAAASGVLVGSRHTAESLWRAVGDPTLPDRTRLGPPGVDVEAFAPLDRARAPAALDRLASAIRSTAAGSGFGRRSEDAARAIEALARTRGPRVVFVGKLIDTKGVDLLLAAWPLVFAEQPGARLVIVGFGEGRERLEALAGALLAGDVEAARGLAAGGPAGGADGQPLKMLRAFLAGAPAGYSEAARAASGSVSFAGRLEHEEVARLVPACDAMVVPSTFPEAFGMVAAEAASAGVIPICAEHSGLLEVTRALAPELPADVGRLLSFRLGPHAVPDIADRLRAWLALPEADREPARRELARRAQELWSWERVASGVLAASAGRLAELPLVPRD